jgi:hypothetical protein
MTDEAEIRSDHEDMRDAVRAALHQHSETSPVESAPTGASPDAPEHSEALDMAEQVAAQLAETDLQRETGQQRDQRGRFAKATSDAPNGSFGPPTSWSADAKAAWQNLAPEVQAAISKREGEMAKGFEQYRNRSQSNDELEQVLAPHRQTYAQLGFQSDSQAIRHLFEINQAFQTAPAATAFRIISAMPAGEQQRLREALNGGSPQYTPDQFKRAVQQQAEQLAHEMVARHRVADFERNAPSDWAEVKPLAWAALQQGLAADLSQAYDVVTAPARRAAEQAAKLDRKTKAANASLNGAPHGVSTSQPPRSNGKGSFRDVADDVRAAIGSLS